jgi:CheY-like chemotaxis protein
MPARILVVDDDPWILRMVSATLTKRGYVSETATDGQQALEKARAQPPDLVITDLMMPVMDGWALVQQMRGIPPLANVPIIFLTALGKDEARLQALGLGPDDYVAKPFRFADLEKRVSAALQSKPSRAAATHESQVGPLPGAYPGHGGYPHGYPPTHESQVGPLPGYPHGYPPTHESQVGPLPGYPHGYPQGYPPYYPPPGYPPQGYPAHAGYPPPAPQAAASAPQTPPPAESVPSAGPPPPPPASASGRTIEGVQVPRRSTALNGRLEQLGLSSLLVMMEMERKDGVLTLKDAKSGDIGRIFLRRGQVVCARLDEAPERDDKECVYEMLVWRGGTFSFNAMDVEMEDTVQSSTTHLLMEGARLIDEANRDGGL